MAGRAGERLSHALLEGPAQTTPPVPPRQPLPVPAPRWGRDGDIQSGASGGQTHIVILLLLPGHTMARVCVGPPEGQMRTAPCLAA